MEVTAMAAYKVICGIPGKYFDDDSYHDLLNYIFSESKTNLIDLNARAGAILVIADILQVVD